MTTRAVLTGDLVRSTDLTDAALNAARHALLSAMTDIGGWKLNLLGSAPDIFRGDGWQILLTEPGYCLRAAFYIRACLKAQALNWDTRISIGLGKVSHVDRNQTSLSTGEAFLLSGQALDVMPSGTNLVVAMAAGIRGWNALSPLGMITSSLIDDWSQKQAMVACLALAPSPLTQAEMAERLGISQQAVSKALAAAKVSLLLQATSFCESMNWRRIEMI